MLKKVGEKGFRKYIWVALSLFLVITVFLGSQLSNLWFDYDFEKFFPAEDAETDFFFDHRDHFGSDNDFLLVAIERKDGVFDKQFLLDVDSLAKEIESIPQVSLVVSLTSQEEVFIHKGLFGDVTTRRKYINFEDFNPSRDSANIFENVELVNSLIAENAKSVCLFVKHEDYISKKRSDSLATNIRSKVDLFSFENVRVAGRTIGQKYYIDQMSEEMMVFILIGVLLVIVFLLIAFKSIWGLLLPQFVILGAMIWLVGGMGLFDQPINIILTTIPSIMFVVSMSDVIHLVSRYLDSLRDGNEKFAAIKQAINEVGLATLLTSVTTAIGFFSLYFVKVQPIQIYGVVVGIGVLIAFVMTFLLLPVFFYIFPDPKYIKKKKETQFWKRHLINWLQYIIRKRKRVLFISSVILAISLLGMSFIESNSYLMDDLSKNEPIKQDFDFLDENYGGVRHFELAIEVKDSTKNAWDLEVLQQIDTVENYIEQLYGAEIHTSVVQLLKVLNRSTKNGDPEAFQLPDSRRKIRKHRMALRVTDEGKFINNFMDTTQRILRLGGTISDMGNVVVSAKNDSLREFMKLHDLDGAIKYQITGSAYLIDKNMRYLSKSLVYGITISILIVALLMGIVYRSITILVISIVTNVIPLIVIAGLMGYVGIELKISTAIIFTIAFGIAVDDTIHFLGKFKYELMKGKSMAYALKRSYLTTGKAMILTSLILCAGFLMLILSSFLGTVYMGMLLCITLLVALIADLSILPVLLILFYKQKK
jgi:predicted RND superfamily exporter protein